MQLEKDFFKRDVTQVARDLLGCKLSVSREGGVFRSVICETEAYDGEFDLACHASRGKTPRNSVMYGEPGVWYLYLCYGMHWMLNVVAGPKGYPAAVLLRGCEHFAGPGRLSKGLGLNGVFNGLPAKRDCGLWIESGERQPGEIFSGPRIGVDYAGPEWSAKPYRFWFSNA